MFKSIPTVLLLAIAVLALGVANPVNAVPVAGVDFANGQGGFDITPDDLDLGDTITVNDWVFQNGAGITNDGNAQNGRASAPVGKFNGQNGAAQPNVGDAAPTNNIHSFSITIPNDIKFNLTDVAFDHSPATGGGDARWLAFKTSLDSTLIYSDSGSARPAFESVFLSLAGSQYEGLSGVTVDFEFYAGGPGSGDIDIDSIVVGGFVVPIPEPATATLGLIGMAGLVMRRRRVA